jgi:hypothetical protein
VAVKRYQLVDDLEATGHVYDSAYGYGGCDAGDCYTKNSASPSDESGYSVLDTG